MTDPTVTDGAGSPARDGDAFTESPTWLTPDPDETLRWRGSPRIQTILPVVVVGAGLVVVGVALLAGLLEIPDADELVSLAAGALAVLVGLIAPAWAYVWVTNVDYVVTDRTLYRKRGVLSRSVTAVGFETVQNVSYARGLTGSLFGYGTLSFDTAGSEGTELAFRHVDDPQAVRQVVEEQLSRVRREDDRADGAHGTNGAVGGVPGTAEQWEAVLEEVRAVRRALDAESGR